MESDIRNIIKWALFCGAMAVLFGFIVWGLLYQSPQTRTNEAVLVTAEAPAQSLIEEQTTPDSIVEESSYVTAKAPTQALGDLEVAATTAEEVVRLYSSVVSYGQSQEALAKMGKLATPGLVGRLEAVWSTLPEIPVTASIDLVERHGDIAIGNGHVRFEVQVNQSIDFGVGTQVQHRTIFVTLKPNVSGESWTVTDIREVGFEF